MNIVSCKMYLYQTKKKWTWFNWLTLELTNWCLDSIDVNLILITRYRTQQTHWHKFGNTTYRWWNTKLGFVMIPRKSIIEKDVQWWWWKSILLQACQRLFKLDSGLVHLTFVQMFPFFSPMLILIEFSV